MEQSPLPFLEWARRTALSDERSEESKGNTCCFYILRLQSGRLYCGTTEDLDARWREHLAGKCRTTRTDAPTALLYSEFYPDRKAARLREAQVKRWTRAKKEALIAGDMQCLHELAKRRGP